MQSHSDTDDIDTAHFTLQCVYLNEMPPVVLYSAENAPERPAGQHEYTRTVQLYGHGACLKVSAKRLPTQKGHGGIDTN